MSDNPFDRFDLDPGASVDALTERLRELAADATGAEADAVRTAWEELTLHARTRVVLALTTFFDDGPRPVAPEPAPSPSEGADASGSACLESEVIRLVEACPPASTAVLDAARAITEDSLLDEGTR